MPDAILAMVRDAVPPDVTVYDGQVPEQPPDRYVVLYMDNGTRRAEGVEHQSTGRLFRWQVTTVAPDRGMAGWLAEAVADALTDQRPDVPGWSPGLIEHTHSRTPRADEQVLARTVVVAFDLYQLLAEKLPAAV